MKIKRRKAENIIYKNHRYDNFLFKFYQKQNLKKKRLRM